MKALLDDAMTDYLALRSSQDLSRQTLANEKGVLRRFLTVNGNIYLHNVSQRHVVRHFEEASKTRKPASLRLDNTVLKGFFEWARQTRRMATDNDPMYGRRQPRLTRRERQRVHVSQFDRLLQEAGAQDPRNRALVAVLLYLLLRDQDAARIRVGDVDLNARSVHCYISKSRIEDNMPMFLELEDELREWLALYSTYVAEEYGRPLRPSDYLIPLRRPVVSSRDSQGKITKWEFVYVPDQKVGKSRSVVKPALEAIGFPLIDEDGQSLYEGAHTLRRSGARAKFDQLCALGYDKSLRIVQALLHHSSMEITERYIGITADKRERDEIIRGRPMYKVEDETVIELVR